MMYTIDLFKGRNLPDRSSTATKFIVVIAFTIPAILTLIIFTGHYKNKAVLLRQQTRLKQLDAKIAELQKPRTDADSIARKTSDINMCLVDVSDALGRFTQWSDILVELGQNMPDSLIVDGVDVTVRSKNNQVKSKTDKTKILNIRVPTRTMVISMYTYTASTGDEDVRKLQKTIAASKSFSRFVDEVIIAVREPDELNSKQVIRYEINCVLKGYK